jgi:hypothetical protein
MAEAIVVQGKRPRYEWVAVNIVSTKEDETSANTVNCCVDRRGDFVTPCTVPLCCNALSSLLSSAFANARIHCSAPSKSSTIKLSGA